MAAAAAATQPPPASGPEPLLDENPDRYCMFPVREDSVWNEYKKAEVGCGTARRRALWRCLDVC